MSVIFTPKMVTLPEEIILHIVLLADSSTAHSIYKALGYDTAWIKKEMSKRKDVYLWKGEYVALPEDVTFLIIEEGIHKISRYAFHDEKNLKNVIIPKSVRKIRHGAFHGCISLKNVIIPNGVTSISDLAFYNCRSLTSMFFPDNVRKIGASAFYGCGLKSVFMSKATHLGVFAFNIRTKITTY